MCGHSFHPRHAKTAYPGPRFWRNGRVEFSFLAYTISKNAIANDPTAGFVVQEPPTKKMWMAG
jgi:hypothetical protein